MAERPDVSIRDRVLHAVTNNDITRSPRGLRWYTSEYDYRTLTPAEKRHLDALRREGRVAFEVTAGQRDGRRGYFVIAAPEPASPSRSEL